jgi:hypothetical protein
LSQVRVRPRATEFVQDIQRPGGGGGVGCCAAVVDETILAPYRKIALSRGLVNGQITFGMKSASSPVPACGARHARKGFLAG